MRKKEESEKKINIGENKSKKEMGRKQIIIKKIIEP